MGPTSLFQGEGEKVGYRRVSPVPGRPGEGPLTERTAGVQPPPQERVLMPRTGHCCCQAVCRPVLPLKRPPQEPMARYRRNEFGQASDLSARLMQIKVRRDSGLIALCAMKSPLSVAAALVPVSALAAETPAESYTWGHPMMWGWGDLRAAIHDPGACGRDRGSGAYCPLARRSLVWCRAAALFTPWPHAARHPQRALCTGRN